MAELAEVDGSDNKFTEKTLSYAKYAEMYGILASAVLKVGSSLLLDKLGLLGAGNSQFPFAPFECKHLVGEKGNRRLEKCLQHTNTIGNDVVVADIGMEYFGEGVGLASEMARLDVAYKGAVTGKEPRFMVAKFSPKVLGIRLLAELYKAMQVESLFYNEVKGELERNTSIKCPECYFTAFDKQSQRVIIIMEDLSCTALDAVRGGNHLPEGVPNQIEGVSASDTVEVMDALAEMHGHFWAEQDRGVARWALPWQHKSFQATAPMVIKDSVKTIPQVWADITGEQISASFMSTARAYMCCASQLYCPKNNWIQGGPITLIHGDCRRNNMVYVQRARHAATLHFIDFQMIRWARGEDDVAYYIFSSMRDPLAHWEELLRHYHTRLVARLTASGKIPAGGYTFEQCVFNFWCGMIWENLTIFLVMANNADLKGDGTLLMQKYGRSFFRAQEQCDFPKLIRRMLDRRTMGGAAGFDPDALWECMRKPLKTAAPAARL